MMGMQKAQKQRYMEVAIWASIKIKNKIKACVEDKEELLAYFQLDDGDTHKSFKTNNN